MQNYESSFPLKGKRSPIKDLEEDIKLIEKMEHLREMSIGYKTER